MNPTANEVTARMSWLYAEGESWWVISGTTIDGGEVTDCIAEVVPSFVTGVDEGDGFSLFQATMFGGSTVLVSADRITRAKRLIFVFAEDPETAYYADEQDFLAGEDR